MAGKNSLATVSGWHKIWDSRKADRPCLHEGRTRHYRDVKIYWPAHRCSIRVCLSRQGELFRSEADSFIFTIKRSLQPTACYETPAVDLYSIRTFMEETSRLYLQKQRPWLPSISDIDWTAARPRSLTHSLCYRRLQIHPSDDMR